MSEEKSQSIEVDHIDGRIWSLELYEKLEKKILDLEQEGYRKDGIIRSQVEALNHWRREFDAEHAAHVEAQKPLEDIVASWVDSRIGKGHMGAPERAMRLLEEVLEYCQALEIDPVKAVALLVHVYGRPAGDPGKELAGVAFAILGCCAAADVKFRDIALEEIARNEARSLSQIAESHARKVVAGLVEG